MESKKHSKEITKEATNVKRLKLDDQAQEDSNYQTDGSVTSIRAASRKTRVYVFRDFIMDQYNEYLPKGSIVLDVAGGKGDLSWLLRNVDDLDSVVVDPRLTKNHIVKSVRYLRDHPEEAKLRAIPGLPMRQPLAVLLPKLEGKETFDSPRHLRILVDQDLVEAVRNYKEEGSSLKEWEEFWTKATAKARQAHTLGYEERAQNEGLEIKAASAAIETLLSTKLVLGFHPDQATDAAFELAKVLEIPYCIVPCCVFKKEFPHRRGPDGNPVRTYTDLIEYLRHKYGDGMKEAYLPFHFTETAKNLTLYTIPIANTQSKESLTTDTTMLRSNAITEGD